MKYLTGCADFFRRGITNVGQFTLVKGASGRQAFASRFFSALTSKSAGGQDKSSPSSASISSSVMASRLYHLRSHGITCHGA